MYSGKLFRRAGTNTEEVRLPQPSGWWSKLPTHDDHVAHSTACVAVTLATSSVASDHYTDPLTCVRTKFHFTVDCRGNDRITCSLLLKGRHKFVPIDIQSMYSSIRVSQAVIL